MAQNFVQLRFYNEAENNDYNYPSNVKMEDFINGNAIREYRPINQIGIQAPPGTKFTINGAAYDTIIGYTGLFELNLANTGTTISSLIFDDASMKAINDNVNSSLIIDIVYET